MATQTSRRLPGIRFEVQPPPSTDVLPRMDVAVFVGFAASGPLHTPVAVEDVAHFTAIFGNDLPLAWDAQSGEIVYAYLASAVRAFFRNGGLRCWIIRVGNHAIYNTFLLPGVMQAQWNPRSKQWNIAVARLQAVSPGSGSDTLQVGTTLSSDAATINTPTFSSDKTSIAFTLTSTFDIPEGSLLQVRYVDDKGVPKYILFSFLENIALTQAKTVANSSQQFSAIAKTFLLFQAPLANPPRLIAPIPDQPGRPDVHATVLSFELWARYEDGSMANTSDLGFSPAHPRYWAALPIDKQIYATANPSTANPYAALWQEAIQQYFPLGSGNTDTIFYFPVNMAATLVKSEFTSAEKHAGISLDAPASGLRPETPLDRDGLTIFDSTLFLDQDLQDSTTENLLAQADYISYQSPEPRSLQGIHAALYIDEATLIAVPEAVHLGWTSIYNAGDPPGPVAPTPPVTPIPTAPAPTFQRCAVVPVTPTPVVTQPQPKIQVDNFMLTWTAVGAAGQTVRYTLQEATRPDFGDAVTIYTGSETSRTIYGRSPRDYYYQVNAQIEDNISSVSAWSNGVVIRIAPAAAWQVNTPETYNQLPHAPLLRIQRALLPLCGARGDVFVVMALPAHYREDAAITHILQLKSSFPPGTSVRALDVDLLGHDEARAFSFGALYHPWLIGRENNQLDELRQTPPDGAAAGIIARRASTRGAWIAPANEVLSNVVALTPSLARERWLDLQEAQLNIIRQEPRGFLYLSADTLSDDSELRPINVRRLLILLRRLALRLGADYVFEPNNDAFRRAVQRGFEALLEQLFVRGAFAGNVASEGFQVVTKSYLNTPQSVEQGRFIVEIKVAPAQPLTFLTVRLLQSNDGSLVTEG